jgi:hypothetical protein
VTLPGDPCFVCGVPDPGHDWGEHDRQAAGVRWVGPEPVRVRIGAPAGEELRGLPDMLRRSSSRGGAQVRWLAVHSTEGIMRAADLRAWSSWPGSSHASADQYGNLLEPDDGFVPYDRSAWTLRDGNPVSENIELCAFARWTRAEWLERPQLLELCAVWLARRYRAHGGRIPLRKLTVQQVAAGWAGVIDHDDYTDATGDGNHWDVGEQFPWDVVIPRARTLAGLDEPEGFMAGLSDSEQSEALTILRDLQYGLRRPVVNGLSLSGAMRDVHNRVRALSADQPVPVTATGDLEDAPVAPWSDEQVDMLAEQLEAELSPQQVQQLLTRLQP